MTENTNSSRAVTVEVKNLTKSFNGTVVFENLNFQISRGETFVIMGPSGSGKSVLLRHLIGLERPVSGDVLVDGISVFSAQFRDKVNAAMVFQSGALFNSMTVRENMELYFRERDTGVSRKEVAERIDRRLHDLGIADAADKIPAELSGGMRKRVAIGRALVMEPSLLLYDEPTSELDPIMAANISNLIKDLQNEIRVTTIVVTHDRELAFAVGDRAALIGEENHFQFLGTPEELKNSPDKKIQAFLHPDYGG